MNLKDFLINNEQARRIFGKQEIEIISKQLCGRALSQSERNRLSRDIRPKLRFIDECSEFKEFFDLKKNLINKSIIDESVKLILKDEISGRIDSILLFGSIVDGTFNDKSDIDIAIVFKDEISLNGATLFRKRLMAQLSGKVDLQVFNLLPLEIKSSIARKHKILFKSSSFDNTKFIIKQMHEFWDMKNQVKRLAKL